MLSRALAKVAPRPAVTGDGRAHDSPPVAVAPIAARAAAASAAPSSVETSALVGCAPPVPLLIIVVPAGS